LVNFLPYRDSVTRFFASDTGSKFATSSPCVVDTGGKFAIGVIDNGGKFAAGINDAGQVSTTSAANLPPVWLTPVATNETNIRLKTP
jgi:hypothetical protein